MPLHPPRIIFASLFASNLIFPKQNSLRKSQNLVLKSSEYIPLTRTHFQKRAYYAVFFGLTSLHSVTIQPNSKLYPLPPKFSGSAPGCAQIPSSEPSVTSFLFNLFELQSHVQVMIL